MLPVWTYNMIDNVEQSPNRNNNGILTRKEDNIIHMLTELLKLIYWFILAGLYELIYSKHIKEYFFLATNSMKHNNMRYQSRFYGLLVGTYHFL